MTLTSPINTPNAVMTSVQTPNVQALPRRPTRWNAWDRVQQTYCCGKWWNGDTCLYGCHKLK